MEIAYDLCNWGAQTSIVIRSPTHVLTKEYGIQRPRKGPFSLKKDTERSFVMPTIKDIKDDQIKFTNGQEKQYDAIVFATGFKSTVRKWLKDDGGLFNEEGMPKHKSPNHWKGEYGIYCVGFASARLFGISNDAKNIANDISQLCVVNEGAANEYSVNECVVNEGAANECAANEYSINECVVNALNMMRAPYKDKNDYSNFCK
ncbi:putative indole-3-pyruvate monooxygenase YUCCA11 [Bidens hawaiensis]|uniref:putative indole-3-pyruvate monooxygenase YUCCA11 n=1 Tax=Bidens hawaiensis TaxID=980011 RepID=UPI0040492993